MFNLFKSKLRDIDDDTVARQEQWRRLGCNLLKKYDTGTTDGCQPPLQDLDFYKLYLNIYGLSCEEEPKVTTLSRKPGMASGMTFDAFQAIMSLMLRACL